MNQFAVAKIIQDYWTQATDVGNPKFEKPAFPPFVGYGQCGNQEGEYGLAWPPGSGDGKKAHGIAQWHADRAARILQETGIDIRTASCLDQQRAMWWEISNHTHSRWLLPHCLEGLHAAKNAQDVVDVMVDKFEYSGNRVRDKKRRGDDALKWRDYFQARV